MSSILSAALKSFLCWLLFFYCLPSGRCQAQTADEDCLSCHGDADQVKTVIAPEASLKKSVHADLSCTDCHETAEAPKHAKELPPANCAGCHEEEEASYKDSIHALARIEDDLLKPSCKSCHGAHSILDKKNKDSLINRQNISSTCGDCHSRPKVIERLSRRGLNPVADYEHSAHARAFEDPSKKSATCIDCHSFHGIYAPLDPRSTINKLSIPDTCGKCHSEQSADYRVSVHWTAVKEFGRPEAPVCHDCHGEHWAAAPGAREQMPPALASSQLCANCHANRVMMRRFGLDAERFSSWLRTYHGLAVLRGSPRAASCTSCHEKHAVRAADDPRSSVHQANREATCAQCHSNVTPGFADIEVHPINQKQRNPAAYFFRMFYIWMILLVIGGMVIHNAVIVLYFLVEHWQAQQARPRIRRFPAFQLVQHLLLMVSFTVLAVTGFALKFPEAGWVKLLAASGMDEPVRSAIHRGAGFVLIVISLLQLVYFTIDRRGRREVLELIPRWSDFSGLWKSMAFYLRLSKEHPQFGRYNYAEKAEYLALIWGTAVMAATGLVLWFPEAFMRFLPALAFEVSEVVHYYEAILAVAAIIVWHLFFTIYHPDVYPMSTTWLDGMIGEEDQIKHHPLETVEQEEVVLEEPSEE